MTRRPACLPSAHWNTHGSRTKSSWMYHPQRTKKNPATSSSTLFLLFTSHAFTHPSCVLLVTAHPSLFFSLSIVAQENLYITFHLLPHFFAPLFPSLRFGLFVFAWFIICFQLFITRHTDTQKLLERNPIDCLVVVVVKRPDSTKRKKAEHKKKIDRSLLSLFLVILEPQHARILIDRHISIPTATTRAREDSMIRNPRDCSRSNAHDEPWDGRNGG